MNFSYLSDIEPIPQDDGPDPVCSIAYTTEFTQAFDYLRALLKVDERSERALKLTTSCLKLNPANYTVWHFRRRCLIALSGSEGGKSERDDITTTKTIDVELIKKDLDFADRLGGTNPKNYQLWYHRRALLEFRFKEGQPDEALQVAKTELDYVDKILGDDSKNYHAWSHRQWIIRTLNIPELWSSEIDYSHSKILSDPRNNSAWNQRWFALHEGNVAYAAASTGGGRNSSVPSLEKAKEEASYALSGAKVDPYNESPWRYLIGVLMEQWRLVEKVKGSVDKVTELIQETIAAIKEMKQSREKQPSSEDNPTESHSVGVCVSQLSALVDLLELFTDEKELLTEAKVICGELMLEDPVRRKYWYKREKEVVKLLEA